MGARYPIGSAGDTYCKCLKTGVLTGVLAEEGKQSHREHGEHVGEGVIDVGVAIIDARLLAGTVAVELQAGQPALDRARRQPNLRLPQAHARLRTRAYKL